VSGHTPAPWDCTGCMFPDDDMGGVYYRVQADGIDASAANARLIAAAPEMLAELEEVLAWATIERAPLRDTEIASIRALIAKATGEQP